MKLQIGDQFQAVFGPQTQIKKGHIENTLLDLVDGIVKIADRTDLAAFDFQTDGDGFANIRFIIDDQYIKLV